LKLAILNITAGGISGGYLKYLLHLVPRLSSNPSIEKILCALPSSVALSHFTHSCRNSEFINMAPVNIVHSKAYSEVRIILDKFQPDVVYIPVERFFSYENAPVVNMLQNMEPFIWPYAGNPFLEKLKNWLRAGNARKALKKADRIIAISKFVKDHMTNILNIDPRKIGLVYHGVDMPENSSVRPASLPAECNEFLFTAGSIRPARGLEDIIRAWRILDAGKPVKLAIAGNVDSAMEPYFQELQKVVNNYGIADRVLWLGKLDEREMAWCYQNCTAFVVTSRVEACPNIVLEAMVHGCISISTENPPMPEFFADAAFYYPPKDCDILARQIQTVLSMSEAKRLAMTLDARATASNFSWEICAQRTVNELQKAME
jgi:glycosyltransferase involved in cell wall biosynthesis